MLREPSHPRDVLLSWLLSLNALKAAIQFSGAVLIAVAYFQLPAPANAASEALGACLLLGVGVLMIGPVFFFLLPGLVLAIGLVQSRLRRPLPAYPCPVCGYDIHATPHLCPECGTKLRWGQLPH